MQLRNTSSTHPGSKSAWEASAIAGGKVLTRATWAGTRLSIRSENRRAKSGQSVAWQSLLLFRFREYFYFTFSLAVRWRLYERSARTRARGGFWFPRPMNLGITAHGKSTVLLSCGADAISGGCMWFIRVALSVLLGVVWPSRRKE